MNFPKYEQEFVNEMNRRNYSKETVKNYVSCLKMLFEFYKEKEHTIEAVDFEERLIGIKSKPDLPAEDIDWVRCENCSFTPSQQPVPQYTVQGYSLDEVVEWTRWLGEMGWYMEKGGD